jgi:hypothetical protein
MGRRKGSKNKTPAQREKEKANKNPVGRPPKLPDIDLKQVERLATFGRLDLSDIGYILNISHETVNAYKKKYPEFLDAIKKGRSKANYNVKQKMFERAIGYTHKEKKIFCVKVEPTEKTPDGVVIKEVEVDKYYPPDPTSFIFWMCNQVPDEWKRDRQSKEDTIDRAEELKAIAEILDKRNRRNK